MLKADLAHQLQLLELQELDARIDTLNHRLGSLPETAQVEKLSKQRTAVDNAARDLRIQVDDLAAEQRRADADVEQVKARKKRDQEKLDSGAITDPKALEGMMSELTALDKRIGDLEDVELEVMERLESAQSSLSERGAQVGKIDEDLATLRATLESKAGELNSELEQVRANRAEQATKVVADLVELYEKLRAKNGGIGAAALHRKECGGCRLTLNPADLSVIAKAPEDEVVRCEECGRILVRTAESGL